MNALIHSLLTFVLLYKYAAIFLITFLGEMAVPVPAGGILIASGFFATEGYLSFPLVLLSGILGNIVADNVGYWLSRRYGETVLNRIGLGRVIRSASFRALESKLSTHPKSTVFLSRFTLTPVVNVLAGLAKLPFRTFLIVDIIGEIGDVLLLCGCGVVFGDNWQYFSSVVGSVTSAIAVIALLVVIVVWRRLARRRAAAH